MKKSRLISLSVIAIIISILIVLSSSASVSAAEITQTADQLKSGLEQVGQVGNVLTHPETQAEIVKGKWAEFIAKTAVGKFFVAATPYIKKFDPIFKLILGTGFEWTWVFILSFVLASSLILFFKRITSVFTVSFQIKSKLLDYGIPLLLTILISLTNITITLTRLIVKLINVWFTSVLMQMVAGVGVAVLIFWFFSLSGIVKQLANAIRDALEKRKSKKNVEELKKDVEELKKEVKEEKEKGEKRARGEEVPTEKEIEEELEGEESEEEKKKKSKLKEMGEEFLEDIGRALGGKENDPYHPGGEPWHM